MARAPRVETSLDRPPLPSERRTDKYRARQGEIVRAAATLINRKGVRGMTLADVAAALGMVPTGVIYYFPSKEALAAACFLEAIGAYERMIAAAEAGADRADRLARFVRDYFEHARLAGLGAEDRLVVFNDVRALNDATVDAAYVRMFRRARDLLRDDRREPPDHAFNAVAHLVISQIFWSRVWLPLYDAPDQSRAAERLLDILSNGLSAGRGRQWEAAAPPTTPQDPATADPFRENFLRAATQIINEEGYRGASVDKISARLKVTKGSFYHHNEAKDDLVVACFQRSFEVMRRAQRAAAAEADGWTRIRTAVVSLVEHEVTGDVPLLRTSALTSTPEEMQAALLAEFNRISLSFGSMVSDGIADGSVRPVDAAIAAQAITTTINAAAELRRWAPRLSPHDAARTYVRALLEGVDAALA